ncbi:MAG TPA: hypothetical protein VHT26_03780 [Trebonia sp.]|nr:hypothetical protein [Trebonia sp.]
MNSRYLNAADREGARRQRTLVTGDPLAMRPSRVTDRLLARMLGASLDRQLAAGRTPESSSLLAARAQRVVAMRSRQRLARDWENLLRVARRAHGPYHHALPVCSDHVIAAEPAVRELVRCMTAPLPVAARGVAMATVLLTDALGPVYNRRSEVTLAAALEAAIAQLDPALPLESGVQVTP